MVKFKPAGDLALVISFGEVIDENVNRKVHAVAKAIERANPEWLIEVVPTYSTVYVYYDPLMVSYTKVAEAVKPFLSAESDEEKSRIVEIPTVYGGEFGPDIEFVAQYNGLSVDDVIEIHSKPLYRVYMLGFTPGFAYLGGMDEKIATPRLEKPRLKVPAGSVGIAGKQTGIYPLESPGGWRLIGRTPLKLFDPRKDPPTLLQPGDYVKFVPISEEEFRELYRGGQGND
ncbi:5-oxoprolinase subunit PxpB [Thermococcus sp. GR7]|uniref:5-oxoprolinase subunit PxpB n=1 Tax=unclassified Thermococcus TaxID=2627626 RepID=UPI001432120F|nr:MULTISPECIES: 5-oxoprolinase subunit PxpB [unclassified Thermococcus]NJE47804.1 5-oxoprolinase subunit PxpB [Thermococcus sp. GR7]NJE79166.1 5-oxoprolinase subunit PxpB [Thermococcus sp. GR4]NJF23435.1 5-oxoprolinase subunit PxpB [Thermococcus sp. GR5]